MIEVQYFQVLIIGETIVLLLLDTLVSSVSNCQIIAVWLAFFGSSEWLLTYLDSVTDDFTKRLYSSLDISYIILY